MHQEKSQNAALAIVAIVAVATLFVNYQGGGTGLQVSTSAQNEPVVMRPYITEALTFLSENSDTYTVVLPRTQGAEMVKTGAQIARKWAIIKSALADERAGGNVFSVGVFDEDTGGVDGFIPSLSSIVSRAKTVGQVMREGHYDALLYTLLVNNQPTIYLVLKDVSQGVHIVESIAESIALAELPKAAVVGLRNGVWVGLTIKDLQKEIVEPKKPLPVPPSLPKDEPGESPERRPKAEPKELSLADVMEVVTHESLPLTIGAKAAVEDSIAAVDLSGRWNLPTETDKEAVPGAPKIIVGGPCANGVAGQLMGHPWINGKASPDCTQGFKKGVGYILTTTSQHGVDYIIVAGYDAINTRQAAKALLKISEDANLASNTWYDVIQTGEGLDEYTYKIHESVTQNEERKKKKEYPCPVYTIPWCEGGTIVPGVKDPETGCYGPDTCKKSEPKKEQPIEKKEQPTEKREVAFRPECSVKGMSASDKAMACALLQDNYDFGEFDLACARQMASECGTTLSE